MTPKQKAAEIIEQARQEADQIIRKAEAKKLRLKKSWTRFSKMLSRTGLPLDIRKGWRQGIKRLKPNCRISS